MTYFVLCEKELIGSTPQTLMQIGLSTGDTQISAEQRETSKSNPLLKKEHSQTLDPRLWWNWSVVNAWWLKCILLSLQRLITDHSAKIDAQQMYCYNPPLSFSGLQKTGIGMNLLHIKISHPSNVTGHLFRAGREREKLSSQCGTQRQGEHCATRLLKTPSRSCISLTSVNQQN